MDLDGKLRANPGHPQRRCSGYRYSTAHAVCDAPRVLGNPPVSGLLNSYEHANFNSARTIADGHSLGFVPFVKERQRVTAAMLPTGELLSELGPSFRFEDNRLISPLT